MKNSELVAGGDARLLRKAGQTLAKVTAKPWVSLPIDIDLID